VLMARRGGVEIDAEYKERRRVKRRTSRGLYTGEA